MVSRRLPSLNGLRAFEAAARHGSFVGAADELNVTQAAISRMVRLLEERFGFQLFERRPNGLDLTAQGKALQPGLTSAFDAIAGIAEQVGAMRTTPVLTLGVGPSFAVRWLIPKLRSFYELHPEIEVRLATGGAINPYRDDWTCGVLLGDGNWPGYEAEPLFSADLFPVCTKAIAARLKQPSQLAKETLLQVSHWPEDWTLWLAAAGVNLRRRVVGPTFDNYAMALQAAVDGAGVAMALRPYVEDDIAAGRLVAPFALSVPKGRAWYLVYRPFRKDDANLSAFRAWLRNAFADKNVAGRGGRVQPRGLSDR
ncbi:LysR family transcriptional regulator [Bradyrhizobium manausense]|uniref:LysR substrate-binding domain-containing protein n=1 Tax=Bradyrhizobium TaxID=374 RepID=UPI001BACFE91|nr:MULTISPECIES: LysR substrate-binding domain-containing protein [Bradyrhizobium]MBR0828989.1 LysR family transcriptional regulator [Bradyrhizobium manausense]UVO28006.1 LysR family transcriptional regulator [Bradyrhizobium arachidis]